MNDERAELQRDLNDALNYVRSVIPDDIDVKFDSTHERGAAKIISVCNNYPWRHPWKGRNILFLGDEGLHDGDPHTTEDTNAKQNAINVAHPKRVRVHTYLGTRYAPQSSTWDWLANKSDFSWLSAHTGAKRFVAPHPGGMRDIITQILADRSYPTPPPAPPPPPPTPTPTTFSVTITTKWHNGTDWVNLTPDIKLATDDHLEFTATASTSTISSFSWTDQAGGITTQGPTGSSPIAKWETRAGMVGRHTVGIEVESTNGVKGRQSTSYDATSLNISAEYTPRNSATTLPLDSSTSRTISQGDDVEFSAVLHPPSNNAEYEWIAELNGQYSIQSNQKVWKSTFLVPGFYNIMLNVKNATTKPMERQFTLVVRNTDSVLKAYYQPKNETQWMKLDRGETVFEGDKIKFTAFMDPPIFNGMYYWTIKKGNGNVYEDFSGNDGDWEWEPTLLGPGEYVIECLASQINYTFPLMQWNLRVTAHSLTENEEYSFKLENVSDQIVSITPGKSSSDSLQVSLSANNVGPIGGIPINWKIHGFPFSVKGVTDMDGISELAFSLDKSGNFFAIVDGIPIPNMTIPAGERIIQASVMEESMKGFVENDPYGFFVKLEKPQIQIQFLSRTRAEFIQNILQNDGFQLMLTEKNPAGNAPSEIIVQLSTSNYTTDVTLYRQSPAHLESVMYISQRTIPASHFWKTNAVWPMQINAHYKQENAFLPLYPSNVQFQLDRVTKALEMFEELFVQAENTAGLDADTKELLQTRLKGVRNGLYIIRHGWTLDTIKVLVGQKYLELLMSEESTFGLSDPTPADPSKLSVWGSWGQNITFTNPEEAEAVYLAVQQARNATIDDILNIPSQIGSSVWEAIKSLPDMLASPVYGAYTAITGLTLDGERATTFERVMGGGEVLLMLLGGLVKIPAVRTRLARFGRWGRKYMGDNLTDSVSTPSSVSHVPTPDAHPPTPKTARLQTLIDNNKSSIQRHTNDNINRSSRLAAAEQRLQQRIQDWKAETDPVRRARKRVEVRKAVNTRAGIRNAIRKSDDIIQNQRRYMLKHELDLARMQQKTISRNIVEQMTQNDQLPKPRDRINGRSAQRNYEIQNERGLSPQGYVEGTKLTEKLRTPYTHAHNSLGKFNPAKPPRRVRRPHPDHFNPQTLDIADSKYYDFDSLSPRELTLRATWIASTVEKYTIYQRYCIEALTDGTLTPNQVTNLTLRSRIKIITPKTIPPAVLDKIRLLVGRPENFARIDFVVEPARALEWFNY